MAVRMTGMISGLDTETLIKGLVDAQKLKNKRVEDKKTLLTWKQDKWKELNTKLYKFYTEDLSKMKLQSSYMTKSVTTSNDSLVSVTAGTSVSEGAHTLTISNLANPQYVTGGQLTTDKNGTAVTTATKLTDLNITAGTVITIGNGTTPKTLTVGVDTTLSDFINTAKSAGLNANFDATQGRLFISSKEGGTTNGFQITAKDSLNADANALLLNLGLDALKTDGTKYDTASTVSTVIPAENSVITYNGVEITGNSNTVSVNGMTFTLKGVTQGTEVINLNVTNNTQATYDSIKKFIKSYNELLGEMNDLYYAPSTRGYDPLSEDEKGTMTDDQIQKWETKIQDSILRNDSTLSSLLTTMKSKMMSTVVVNGEKYSLSTYGIQTSPTYTEKGLLHIYGDKEDSTYAAKEDKLMKALEADPDKVMDALSGIAQGLYDEMYKKMKAIPNVRSALTFYNDKLMSKQQTEYAKQVATLEDKLVAMEDKYYKQFAAMETAMAKLQSQTNALSGMLGTSNK